MNKNLSAPKIVYNKSVVLDPKCLTKSLALHLKHLNKIQKFEQKFCFASYMFDITIVWTKVLHQKCLNKVLLCIPILEQNSCFASKIFEQSLAFHKQFFNKRLMLHHKHLNKSLSVLLFSIQIFEQKPCFTSKMFEQKTCFSPKMFEQKSCFASTMVAQKCCSASKFLN